MLFSASGLGYYESGRKCENGVDVEGHAVFPQPHSPLGGEHILASLESCPLKRTMTGIKLPPPEVVV